MVVYEKSYMVPITRYIEFEEQPQDKVKARRLQYRVMHYTIIKGILYKRGHTLPYLMYLASTDTDNVMIVVHERIFPDHGGGRSLAHKIIRQGYFWPIMYEDDRELVRRCDECQIFAVIRR